MTTELDQKLVAIETDLKEFSSQVQIIEVKDTESEQQAITFLSAIKARYNRIEQLRKFFVQPLNDQVKAINNKFKLQTEPLAKLEDKIKSALILYVEEKERLAQEEADRLRAEQEEKERIDREKLAKALKAEEEARLKAENARSDASRKKAEEMAEKAKQQRLEATAALENQEMVLVEAPEKSVRAEGGLMTAKKIWTFEVVDEKKLRAFRPDLFILDAKAVQTEIRGGEREIAGLRIYQETSINVKL